MHRRDARQVVEQTLEETQVEKVIRWLGERDFVVIDGGTGTEIEREAGVGAMNIDGWSCWCNVTHPEVVVKVHRTYLEAGADIIIANTYATNPNVMHAAGFTPEQQRQSTLEGVRLARRAVDEFKAQGGRGDPLVVGSLSCHPPKMPHNAEFDKGTWPPPAEEEVNCLHHALLLKEAGVDAIFLEMVWDYDHGIRALRAAASVGLPVFAAACIPLPMTGPLTEVALRRLTIPDDEITLGGSGCTTVVDTVREMVRYPNVVGVNIHHTPLPFVRAALEAVRKAGWKGFVGVYPDHGTFRNPHWEALDLDKATFRMHCEQWVEVTGCKGIGGCCGMGPDVVASIAEHRGKLAERWERWDTAVNGIQEMVKPQVVRKGRSGTWLGLVLLLFAAACYNLMYRQEESLARNTVNQDWARDCGDEWRGVWYFLMDHDNDGTVSINEFSAFLSRRTNIRRRLLRNTGLTFDKLLQRLDPTNTGTITLSNFSRFWRSPIVGYLEEPCPLPKRQGKRPNPRQKRTPPNKK